MSADRWSECPYCIKSAEQFVAEKVKDAEALYGKISLKDFEAMRRAVPVVDHTRTVREDYYVEELTADGIVFSYSANCTVCEFTVNISQRWPLP